MDSRKIVFRETGVVVIGQVICIGLMLGIYALLSRFEQPVWVGAIVGGVLAIANFFLMAVGTSLAADKAMEQDVKSGKNIIKLSFLVRYPVIFIILFAIAKAGVGDPVTLVLPLVFTRFILSIGEFFRKKGDD